MRVALFIVTNIAVLVVISLLVKIFGLDSTMNNYGINYKSLAIFSLVYGSMGSFISLAMSKTIAKRSMGVQLVESPSTEQEMWLIETIKKLAEKAGIGMPEVGVFDSPTPNAFATGMRRNSSLVAVSTGLLDSMQRQEVEAVLGHEVTHVSNGDMITMTLLQGILNAFVLFISRIIGFVMSSGSRNSRGSMRVGSYFGTVIAQIVLGFLAAIIIKWFSRYREFRADAGGARLSGKQNMIDALKALQRVSDPQPLKGQFVGFGVSGVRSSIAKIFATHPPLSVRIRALENS